MEFPIYTSVPKDMKESVDKYGAIILRDCGIDTVKEFSNFVQSLGDTNVDMSCSAGPRVCLENGVFTSNEAPSHKNIPPHHEMAQCVSPPSYVVFYCLVPPLSEGCTPIIRSSSIAKQFRMWFPALSKRLYEEGVRYLREFPSETDYSQPLGKSWKETYHVKNETELKNKLDEQNITWKWISNGVLQTIGPVMSIFKTYLDDEIFFMAAETSFMLPQNSDSKKMLIHGNGELFNDETKEAFIRIGQYAFENSTRIPWCKNDIMIINNSLVMHSRDSFTGPRKIVVALVK